MLRLVTDTAPLTSRERQIAWARAAGRRIGLEMRALVEQDRLCRLWLPYCGYIVIPPPAPAAGAIRA